MATAHKAFAAEDSPEISGGSSPCAPDPADVGFTIAVVGLGAKLARADGVVSDDEIGAFVEAFRPPEGEEHNVRRVFEIARQTVAGFESYAKQISRKYKDRPCVLENVLDGLFHIAAADGAITEEEGDYLRRVAELFGFDDDQFRRVRAAHLGPDLSDPYDVLGVSSKSNADEIRAAWRKLAAEHHPDSMLARGAPGEFIRIAHEKMAAINAAYDKIRADRGLRQIAD
ncbi:MAG: DnaJ family molecular chaperone [Caulobacterales bacterium]